MRCIALALVLVGCSSQPELCSLPAPDPASVEAAALRDQVLTGDAAARQAAADRLCTLGAAGTSTAAALCDHEDVAVKTTGLQVLRRVGDGHPHLVARMGQGLDHPNPRVRAEAAGAAEAVGESAAGLIPSLVRNLGDDDWEVRYHSASALGRTGWQGYEHEAAVMAVARHDLDRRVREAALESHEAIRLAWIRRQKNLPRTY